LVPIASHGSFHILSLSRSQSESKLAELEETVAAGKSGGKRKGAGKGGGGGGGGGPSVNEFGVEVVEVGCQAGQPMLGSGGGGGGGQLGLIWVEVGNLPPAGGTELSHVKLSHAVKTKHHEHGKVNFTPEELGAMGADEIRRDQFVKSVGEGGVITYFMPGECHLSVLSKCAI
jgi:hypothetical protein